MTPPMWLDDRDVNERFDVYEPGSPTFHDVDDLFVHLHLDGPWLDRKLAALRAHASQTDGLIGALGVDSLPPVDRPRAVHRPLRW